MGSGIVGPTLAFCWAAVVLAGPRIRPRQETTVSETSAAPSAAISRGRKRVLISCLCICVLTLFEQPSNDRDWAADNVAQPKVSIEDGIVTIEMFRNSVHSDSGTEVRYETRSFQLGQLDRVWFVMQRFTPLEGIAHNFLTFRVMSDSGPEYFSVSAEVRREQGEEFSPVRGLYRQYELIYVIADEKDEIGMRTVYSPGDEVYLYPVNANPKQIQGLFRNIAARIDGLRSTPEFYHSLLNNCTNNIAWHANDLLTRKVNWLDSRIVAPGYADRYAWELGIIGNPDEDFIALKTRCRIDTIAPSQITESFSEEIRRRISDSSQTR